MEELLLETQANAIKALEQIIADVRNGEIMEFIGMVTMPSGQYRLVGGNTMDRHETAGMLLELAIERLR